MYPKKRRRGFTLVELLVVIGIISVLISLLLPALGKARAAANYIDCQSRLRSMGQALQIYTVQNKGYLPWGAIDRTQPFMNRPNPDPIKEDAWFWTWTLSEILSGKSVLDEDGRAARVSRIFRDVDTIDEYAYFTDSTGNTQPTRWIAHYACNPVVLVQNERDDGPEIVNGWNGSHPSIPADQRRPRKISQFRRTSNTFVVWDGPQAKSLGGNTYGIGTTIDGNAINKTGLFVNHPNPLYTRLDRSVFPGINGQNPVDGKAFQKKYNTDLISAFTSPDGWFTHFRFRHMRNTRLAALCLDGHVEGREVGTVTFGDVAINYVE